MKPNTPEYRKRNRETMKLRRIGNALDLNIVKSRKQRPVIDDFGQFQVRNRRGLVLLGDRFDASAGEVLEFLKRYSAKFFEPEINAKFWRQHLGLEPRTAPPVSETYPIAAKKAPRVSKTPAPKPKTEQQTVSGRFNVMLNGFFSHAVSAATEAEALQLAQAKLGKKTGVTVQPQPIKKRRGR